MSQFSTTNFGLLRYEPESVITFSCGLPGFEDARQFLAIPHDREPALYFLQSLERADLCFLTVPTHVVRQDYVLALSGEDRERLGVGESPVIGREIVALALLSLAEGELPTANLLSPLVIALPSRMAVQAIRPDEAYTCREPLVVEELVCS